MKNEKIVDALNHIDDEYIAEAHEPIHESIYQKYKKPAGVLLACVCVGAILLPQINKTNQVGYSNGMSKQANMDTYQEEASTSESTKMIARDASLSIETNELDKAKKTVQELITTYEGKLTSDSSYLNYNDLTTYSAYLEIPADNLDACIEEAKKIGKVTYYSQYSNDVTESYVESETKLESLEAEKKRVLELYEQANTLEEIIQIEQRLSEIQSDIDYNKEITEYYQKDVTYSSLSITITETYSNENIFLRIGHSLKEGFVNFTEDLGNLFVSLAYYIWFILFILILGFIGKKIYNKVKK